MCNVYCARCTVLSELFALNISVNIRVYTVLLCLLDCFSKVSSDKLKFTTCFIAAQTDCKLWAIDRKCFQTIMMRQGLIRQAQHTAFLKR